MNKFYIYPGNHSNLIKEGLLRRGNWHEENENPNPFMDCNFVWKPTNLSISEYLKLDSITKSRGKNFVQVFNHFENIRGICTKTGLVRSLKKYYHNHFEPRNVGYKAFDSMATSFLITAGVEDSEYSSFVARYKQIVNKSFQKESVPQKHCEGNFWLVKPANLNQGRGIEVFKNLKDINNFLNSKPSDSFWVLQKYIEKPLLYHGRKFDIRVWVVVTTKMEIFLYKKAYIRTSSDEYDLKTSKNYVHLTNNCLQQHGENYGKHEDGNTLPLDCLDELFKEIYPNLDVRLAAHIIPRIKDLIIDTFISAGNLNPSHRRNVFELFGFDFLIDEDLRTWLIEVNTNPYLGIPNNYIASVLPNMIDDMLEISVDHIFPPKNKPRSADRPNYYELIYCEQGSSYYNGPFSARSIFSKNVYPIQSLVPPDFLKKLSQLDRNREGISNYVEQHSLPGVNEEGSVEKEESPSPNGAHVRGGSSDLKSTNPKDNDRNSIESIYKQLCLTMIYKTDVNSSQIANHIGRVLSYIKNWELMSKKDVKLACKTLLLMAQSAGYALLGDQAIILTIARLLRSHDIKSEIKFTLIETINVLAKDMYLKKKLICNHLMQNLITLCLSCCDEKELQNHSKGFLMATLKCLINLGGIFNKKLYIPGETREANKLKSYFMAQGGIIALWIISQKSLDNQMKEYCLNNFLNSLDYKDLEKQLQILEYAVSMPKVFGGNAENQEKSPEQNVFIEENQTDQIEENKENKENKEHKDKKKDKLKRFESEPLFYKTGEFHMMEKALTLKEDQNSQKNLEKIISFAREMLKIIPLEEVRKEFAEFVKTSKEEWEKKEKREAEEKEKKQLMESEKLKKEESKKKDLEEQRRMALETFEKRAKDNLKRQQMEIEKKQKEQEETRLKEMEARKKNIEILMNKKAERMKKEVKFRVEKRDPKRQNINLSPDQVSEGIRSQTLKFYDAEKNKHSDKSPDNKKKLSLSNSGIGLGTGSSPSDMNKKVLSNAIGRNKRELDPVVDLYSGVDEKAKTSNEKLQGLVRMPSNRSASSQLQNQPFSSHSRAENESTAEPDTIKESTSGTVLKTEPRTKDTSDHFRVTKESNKEKSSNQSKLPKIQKAGRTLMAERMSQSPYMKGNEVYPSLKLKGKVESKENLKVKKNIDLAAITPVNHLSEDIKSKTPL